MESLLLLFKAGFFLFHLCFLCTQTVIDLPSPQKSQKVNYASR